MTCPRTTIMSSKTRPAVILSPPEEGDADALGRVHLGSMEGDWVYERRFPKAKRPDWEQRICELDFSYFSSSS